jgi:hypothetical protein
VDKVDKEGEQPVEEPATASGTATPAAVEETETKAEEEPAAPAAEEEKKEEAEVPSEW